MAERRKWNETNSGKKQVLLQTTYAYSTAIARDAISYKQIYTTRRAETQKGTLVFTKWHNKRDIAFLSPKWAFNNGQEEGKWVRSGRH